MIVCEARSIFICIWRFVFNDFHAYISIYINVKFGRLHFVQWTDSDQLEMYLRLIVLVTGLNSFLHKNENAIILQDSMIRDESLYESSGSGSPENTTSEATTMEMSTPEIITPEVTTTEEPKFNTSETIIIIMFSLFGFLFLMMTLVAAGMHKMGLVMVGFSLLIGTGYSYNHN